MFQNNFVSHFLPFQINTTIFIFVIFFTKWLPTAILDVRKSLSVAFLAILDQYETFNLFYFTKWSPAPILDVRKSLSVAFLAILDQYETFNLFYFTKWSPAPILDVRNSLSIVFQINTQL